MSRSNNKIRYIYGLKIFLSQHPAIRRLKRINAPAMHGNKVWVSSLLLIDYIKHIGLTPNAHVLDVGCGWGLAGIYCAQNFNSAVTGVDADDNVFPYLRLHAEINKVKIATIKTKFNGLNRSILNGHEILIGSDICFWENMIKPLRGLIRRAMNNGIKQIILADPGRETFDECVNVFIKREMGELIDWTIKHPHKVQGRIFKYPMSAHG